MRKVILALEQVGVLSRHEREEKPEYEAPTL
jgi:hypothetical protein